MPRAKTAYIVPDERGDLLDQFIERAENALHRTAVAVRERDRLRRQIARLRKQIRQSNVVSERPEVENDSVE